MGFIRTLLAFAFLIENTEASTCKQRITADLPSLSTIREFGKIHLLSVPSGASSPNGSCSWEFSSPKNYMLNIHFVNFTLPRRSAGSGCHGNYALVTASHFSSGAKEVLGKFCSQMDRRSLQINGAVTVDLFYNSSTFGGSAISMAVFVEASTPGCGGVFNDSSGSVPVSFEYDQASNQSPVHCVWNFDFSEPQDLKTLVSYFNIPHDFNYQCSGKKFLGLRSYNETSGVKTGAVRKCAKHNYALPESFNVQSSKRFVVTVHSEGPPSQGEGILAVCLPTSPGVSRQYNRVDDVQNETLAEVARSSASKAAIRGLILLKPIRSKDQLFAFISNVSGICSNGKLQLWSIKSNVFNGDGHVCSNTWSDSALLNANVTLVIYFEAQYADLHGIEMSFFSSNKGCGGIFEFKIGHSMLIKSPNYGGKYPADSECRWMLLRENGTELELTANEMSIEECSYCGGCDYVKIYQGRTSLKKQKFAVCRNSRRPYIINGDVVLYFHSDTVTEMKGFVINVTAFKACGGEFFLSPGQRLEITSPRYKYGSYPPYSLCQWEIIAGGVGLPLDISTTMMDVECIGDYHYDYVEIFKSVGQNRTLMYTLCEKPKRDITINGSITILFQSDGSDSGTGFRIVVSALPGPNESTTSAPPTTSLTSTKSTLPITTPKSDRTTNAQTKKCCPKQTTASFTKVKKSTKADQSRSTVHTNKTLTAKARKSASSTDNVYIASITAGVATMLCIGFLILVILRRRKQNHQGGGGSSEQSPGAKKRKRQNSAMPLVDMEDFRKGSLASNTLGNVIENVAYEEAAMPKREKENPYYSTSDNKRRAKVNPCYASSAEVSNPYYDSSGTLEDVTELVEDDSQHIYSDVQSKDPPNDYSYAENPETPNTGVSGHNGTKEDEENPYEVADYGYVI